MTKLLAVLVVAHTLAVTACAGRPATTTTLDSRAALTRYASGASLDQIATDLKLEDGDAARSLVHDALVDLNRRYYGRR